MPRPESTWLALRAGLRELLLHENHQSYRLFHHFADVSQQTPQMIMMIGQWTKTRILQKLRLSHHRNLESVRGEVHLYIDVDTTQEDSPVIVADCELHNLSAIPKADSGILSGSIVQRPLTWNRKASPIESTILAHMVYSKLMAPFSTVICFFAEDLGGLKAVAELLALWIMNLSARPSDLPYGTYPRVLILTEWRDPKLFDEKKETQNFMRDLGREAEKKHGVLVDRISGKLRKAELDRLLTEQFGDIRVIGIPPVDSPSRLWKTVKSRVINDSNEVQLRRSMAQVAFSVSHFKAFFHLACDHFCSDIITPFSFIQALRIQNPLPTDFEGHIRNFLKQVPSSQLMNFAVPVIASSLVFDAYPPGIH
ncbi:unnamed protein product, partial [Sphagnum balticum]